MTSYTFRHGPFYFQIHAENDKEAVRKARQAIEETAPIAPDTYLKVELTAGAFEGRIYVEPGELGIKDICKREVLSEIEEGVPF